MKVSFPAALALSAAALFSLSAHAATLKSAGGVMVDSKGMTVYTFDKDVANSGKSACVDACAKAWPPVKAGSGDMSITRADGTKQLVQGGKPVYYFAKDTKKGDKNGDNFKDVWHAVKN
jgi:predicted lipoprotein with Yx(FWY)xxD motif